MNKYTYNYRCYKLGEFIFGNLNINSNNDKDVLNEAKDYLYKNVSENFCFINLQNKTKTDDIKQNASHDVHFKIPISYAAK